MRNDVKTIILIGSGAVILFFVAIGSYRAYQEKSSQAQQRTLFEREDSRSLGPRDAPVTLVEFFDPECESCRAFAPRVKEMMVEFSGKLRLVLRYMPFHRNSISAALALEAAGEQGKYWEMLDTLFQFQPEWGDQAVPQSEKFLKYAQQVGLDQRAFLASIEKNELREKILQDQRDGTSLGVRMTPTFFVNQRLVPAFDAEIVRAMIREELQAKAGGR